MASPWHGRALGALVGLPPLLNDWPKWDRYGGDNRCVRYRAYPSEAWGLVTRMLMHSVPTERQWSFESEALELEATRVQTENFNRWIQLASS